MEALNIGRLANASFAKIIGEIGPGKSSTGGTLNVEIKAGLKSIPSEATQAGARVVINVTGLPKGEKELDNFAFRLEVRVHGLFEWERPENKPELSNPETTQLLCQSLYTMAVAEIKALGTRLGFGNIEIPWQLNSTPPSSAEGGRAKSSRRTKSTTTGKAKKATAVA